jgi:hypothetical protein
MRSGYQLEWQLYGHDIRRTTSWGQMTIGGIYLGADWRLQSLALEYMAPASLGAITTVFTNFGFPPQGGEIDVDDAASWPLTGTAQVTKADGTTGVFTYTNKVFRNGPQPFWALIFGAVISGGGGQINDGDPIVLVNQFGGGPPDAAWPWNFATINGGTLPSPVGPKFAVNAGTISRRWEDSAGGLVLTAIVGTPASGNPATLTAPYAISNRRGRLNFDSRLRELPLDFQLLPFTVQGALAQTTLMDAGQNGKALVFPLAADAVLPVASTAGFPQTGSLIIASGGLETTVSYAGYDGGNFFNVQGGAGSFPPGSSVTQSGGGTAAWWTST